MGVVLWCLFVCVCVQGVMVRLMLVLAPVMCILSGIAVSGILTTFMKNLDLMNSRKRKKADTSYPLKNEVSLFVIIMMTFFLITYTFHCTWVGVGVWWVCMLGRMEQLKPLNWQMGWARLGEIIYATGLCR